MPEPYWPKHKNDYVLSRLNDGNAFVRMRCAYCKRTHHYFPTDLIAVFGDVDIDSLMRRTKCEGCGGLIDVDTITPTGQDAVGMVIRRLVAIKVQRIPVWREDR